LAERHQALNWQSAGRRANVIADILQNWRGAAKRYAERNR